jgi:hypothetical protein
MKPFLTISRIYVFIPHQKYKPLCITDFFVNVAG